jgi:hypothetical protein
MAVQFVGSWSGGMPILGFVALSILNPLALALLGPGAYSFDAVRFGRRVVELPSEDEE